MKKLFLLLLSCAMTFISCHKQPVACGHSYIVPFDSMEAPCSCNKVKFVADCSQDADQYQWKIYNDDCPLGHTVLFGREVKFYFSTGGVHKWELTVWHHGRHDEMDGEVDLK